jgi:hypothetical protein
MIVRVVESSVVKVDKKMEDRKAERVQEKVTKVFLYIINIKN